jgi:magnesium-transporting ATPase (P-type)
MASGVKQMAKQKAIVKRLAALEALGSVTNICSDKTGTLTQAKMVATRMWLPKRVEYDITGIGSIPDGDFLDINGDPLEKNFDKLPEQLRQLFLCSTLCSTASIVYAEKAPYTVDAKGRGVRTVGEPTEVAIAVMAAKMNLIKFNLIHEGYKPWRTNEFNSVLKKMSVIISHEKKRIVYLKGAPERVLDSCTQFMDHNSTVQEKTDSFVNKVLKKNEEFASQGLVRHPVSLYYPAAFTDLLMR